MKLDRLKPIHILIGLHAALLLLAIGVIVRQKGRAPLTKEKIALVAIDGEISGEKAGMERGVSVGDIVDAINEFRDDDAVKAMVLRINSPGGSVGAVQEIYSALKKFRAKNKVIVASFGDVAASGGYYLSCASTKIVSEPGTLTGSIGVIMEIPNVQGLLGKIGISMQALKSGSMKDAGSPFRSMTDVETAYFQKVIIDAYDQFFAAVKEGRAMSDETLRPLADGRIFTGRDAKEKQLVDQIGDLEDATELAKELAGLKDKNPEILTYHEKASLARLLDLFSRSPLGDLTAVAKRGKMRLCYLLS